MIMIGSCGTVHCVQSNQHIQDKYKGRLFAGAFFLFNALSLERPVARGRQLPHVQGEGSHIGTGTIT